MELEKNPENFFNGLLNGRHVKSQKKNLKRKKIKIKRHVKSHNKSISYKQ